MTATRKHLNYPNEEDEWTWKLTKDGDYSVKSAYQELMNRKVEDKQNRKQIGIVWNKLVPMKIAVFSWKMLQDRIPTMKNLLQKGAFNPNFSTKCRMCDSIEEEMAHLFFDCRIAANVWRKVNEWLDLDNYSFRSTSSREHLEDFVNLFNGNRKCIGNLIWQNTIWNLWLRRNSTVFSGVYLSDDEVLDKICSNTYAWLKNKNRVSIEASLSDWIRAPEFCIA
ncbi:hypothetical protein ACS0TY_035862 [Phlomoides rotata]